jgi:SAM-dependent methyltransferase
VGDVRALPFADGELDAVYSPGVCEHFEEGPAPVLLETRRVLRPGGIAVISTPCFNGWMRRHLGRFAADAAPAGVPFYQYAFTPDGMARLLADLRFEVLQIRPYATLDTFVRYGGWQVPARVRPALALAMDYLPGLRHWGSACIWVARTC